MEMPFSVVLDFREDAEGGLGGCLQVAAQSGKGQREVLNGMPSSLPTHSPTPIANPRVALTGAHRVWTS
jgi:hypothetical protein